jgi:hypothetical protein
MIQITTKQLASGYYLTESILNGKVISSCCSLNREYTIKAENEIVKITKDNLRK